MFRLIEFRRLGSLFGTFETWIDETPKVPNLKAGDQCSTQIFPGKFVDKDREGRKIIVEHRFPYHVSSYGLLGFEYLPATGNDCLEVNVFYQLPNEKKITLKKSQLMYDAKIGLLKEYTKSILEESAKIIESNNDIPAGKINFLYAAHSPVCSSIMVYNSLVRILFELLRLNSNSIDDGTLTDIVKRHVLMR